MTTPLPSPASPVDGDHIRKAWHNDEWYYSVIDMIAVLLDADHKRAKIYWATLKSRLKAEGNETITDCNRLKLPATDGKMRLTDVVNTEQALRLIQSIPSPKVEPMKLWLAQVGAERLEESNDPEMAELRSELLGEDESALARQRRHERRLQTYVDMGRDADWIALREMSILTRKQFMAIIYDILGRDAPFGQITNDVYKGVFHKTTSQLRTHLGIKSDQNPRDYFSRIALAYTIAAEEGCKIKLAPYGDDDLLPVSVVREIVIMLSMAVGIQADEMARILRIDIVTGRPLLETML